MRISYTYLIYYKMNQNPPTICGVIRYTFMCRFTWRATTAPAVTGEKKSTFETEKERRVRIGPSGLPEASKAEVSDP